MDVILLQLLNGLDKGGAYALIALGLTLIFGTLGVVNFAHGALFMIGAFCAVTFNRLLKTEIVRLDPEKTTPWGTPLEIRTPYVESILGDWGKFLIEYSVPVSILVAIPVMLVIGTSGDITSTGLDIICPTVVSARPNPMATCVTMSFSVTIPTMLASSTTTREDTCLSHMTLMAEPLLTSGETVTTSVLMAFSTVNSAGPKTSSSGTIRSTGAISASWGGSPPPVA